NDGWASGFNASGTSTKTAGAAVLSCAGNAPTDAVAISNETGKRNLDIDVILRSDLPQGSRCARQWNRRRAATLHVARHYRNPLDCACGDVACAPASCPS